MYFLAQAHAQARAWLASARTCVHACAEIVPSRHVFGTVLEHVPKHMPQNRVNTWKFSPPTGGFFLAPMEAWRALWALRWLVILADGQTDGRTHGRTTGSRELDIISILSVRLCVFRNFWHDENCGLGLSYSLSGGGYILYLVYCCSYLVTFVIPTFLHFLA